MSSEEPLFSVIPKLGDYTVGNALAAIEEWVSGQPEDWVVPVSTATGAITLAAWLGTFALGGYLSFTRRDV